LVDEALDGRLVVAELAQDLLAVLAEERRHGDGRPRRGELDGIARGEVVATDGMLNLDDHVPGAQVRILQHLARVEAGTAPHPRPRGFSSRRAWSARRSSPPRGH